MATVCGVRRGRFLSASKIKHPGTNKSPREINALAGLLNNPGDFLLSHAVTRAVPSAPAGLTSVFGMGTGVTLPTKSPENRFEISNLRSEFEISGKKALRIE